VVWSQTTAQERRRLTKARMVRGAGGRKRWERKSRGRWKWKVEVLAVGDRGNRERFRTSSGPVEGAARPAVPVSVQWVSSAGGATRDGSALLQEQELIAGTSTSSCISTRSSRGIFHSSYVELQPSQRSQ